MEAVCVRTSEFDPQLLCNRLGDAGWDARVVLGSRLASTDLDPSSLDLAIVHASDPGSASSVCKRLRMQFADLPIILVAAGNHTTETAIAALDAGACAFLLEGQNDEALVSLAHAVRRRSVEMRSDVLTVGDLELNRASRTVARNRVPIALTTREFDLLEYLMRNRERVVRREAILDAVWGLDYLGASNIVDVYVGYLRRKIDKPFGTSTIRSVRGFGYAIEQSDGRIGVARALPPPREQAATA